MTLLHPGHVPVQTSVQLPCTPLFVSDMCNDSGCRIRSGGGGGGGGGGDSGTGNNQNNNGWNNNNNNNNGWNNGGGNSGSGDNCGQRSCDRWGGACPSLTFEAASQLSPWGSGLTCHARLPAGYWDNSYYWFRGGYWTGANVMAPAFWECGIARP